MTAHERVTDDPRLNAELIAEYETASDTGDAFLARVTALGFNPPDRLDVFRWGFGILAAVDGAEWLVWDAEAVVPGRQASKLPDLRPATKPVH